MQMLHSCLSVVFHAIAMALALACSSREHAGNAAAQKPSPSSAAEQVSMAHASQQTACQSMSTRLPPSSHFLAHT